MSVVSREGLVVELLLDRTADDTSGHGHHGVLHGATPTTDRFGKPGSAYRFDGTDDFIRINPPLLNPTSLSVSMWGRFDSVDLDGWSNCLICQDNGDDRDQSRRIFQLSVFCGHVVWHRMTNARDPASRHLVTPGTWFHAAAVFDGRAHHLYIDGELQASVEHTLHASADQPVDIGRKGTPEQFFFFHGALDDVRVFNRVLGPEEVRALHRERGYEPPPRPPRGSHPLSGIWEADDELRVELAVDRDGRVTGTVPSGRPGNIAVVRDGRFDPDTRTVRLEGEARRPDNDVVVAYMIEGTLEGRRLNVGYRFGELEGRVTLRKTTRWQRTLRRRSRAVGRWAETHLEPILVPFVRTLRGLRRPTKAENTRRLRERAETLASFVFRAAAPDDLSALAALHVKTWAATYPNVRRPPTYEIRERQWREAFARMDGSWFCIVVQNSSGELVGFAKGVKRQEGSGDLDKIYLVGEYQRLGLGRKLVGHVARRFLSSGITAMTLSADAANPSCGFYLALGAEHQRDDRGRVQRGAFVWRDLRTLSAICPVDPVDGPP